MVARSALVALLFLGMGLAGCLSGDGDDGQLETATTNDTLNTAAPEGRETIVAFEETNQTEEGSGGVDHHHDYWAGRTRVQIFETQAMMEPWPSGDGAIATFRPPQGTFVYEATASVEFTITNPQRHACEPLVTFGGHYYCTDYLGSLPAAPAVDDPTGGPSGLKLRYKHASTTQWIDAGEVAWGTPTIIKITDPIQTDMPHATSSVWEFQVVSPHKEDVTLKFTAKAEIVKGEGDIPLWPGHPLFYTDEKPSRVVVNNVQAKACDNGFSNTGCALAGDGVAPVVPDKLISYGTRTLYVWINITDFQAANPATAPSAFFLYHSNATGRTNITDPYNQDTYGIDQRELHWVLPVDDGSMDSPYADGSRWRFELGASYTTPENPVRKLSCYGGCADWAASYTITVVASAEQLPASEYHMFCLDPKNSHCPEPEGGGDEQRELYLREA